VLEVGAVRLDRGDVADEFEQLVSPGDLPEGLREAFGIRRSDLAGEPDEQRALQEFCNFCGPDRVVVYDADVFARFLESAGVSAPPLLNALDFGRIALPTADDYSLPGLAAHLGLAEAEARRALPRARLVAALFDAMGSEVASLPPIALDSICALLDAAGHPLGPIIARFGRAGAFELSADRDRALAETFPPHRELFRRVQKYEAEEPSDEDLPTGKICEMFQPEGLIGRHLSGYEQRPEQVQMTEAVCGALNEPHHLMVEAGTGTGKSLAYLLPAIAWCCVNRDRVVVSTNTRNLQEQLFHKDLPFLTKLLPGRFEPALLKGRRNYLCVRRFLHLMRHFQRELAEPDEHLALACLVAWAARTGTGDLAECNGFFASPGAASVRPAVVSGSEECAGSSCRFRDRCMVRRARALAQLADIIVVNHALLFAEIGTPVLPEYRCVVFDEAQNLEDVATDAFTVSVNNLSIYRVTNLLYRKRQDGSGSGLLAIAMHEADRAGIPDARAEDLKESIGRAMGAVDEVVDASRQFFELLAEPFAEIPPFVERVLLAECQPDIGPGSEAWEAAERLREAMRSLGEGIEAAATVLDPLGEETDEIAELAHDLRASIEQLREVSEAVEFVLTQEEESFVYWLERTIRERGTFYSVHAAPLQVGEYVRNHFFAEKRCVVFTSATLQVDGDFDYMLERLGADQLPPGRIQCLAVGSGFDYDRQVMVGVTTFLPDPGGRRDREFDVQLGEFLCDLLKETRGRALVLFTSYSLLQSAYEAVKGPLEGAGITVLAQGHTGSREAITSFFRAVPSSVLLGTRSFWEGVDIAGETLSCLVLTKLPFHVFTDPLVRGRIGYLQMLGRDPFLHYTLPEAVISFRQGFGRLIRRRTDRGVVVVADRRMVTKDYGRSFLRSLPTGHRVFKKPTQALQAVREFFDAARAALTETD
jgi:predicted DnaQ family exonuclease/DinG family helicase